MNALRSPLKTRLALIALLASSAPALAGSGVTEQTVTIDKLTHVENGAVVSGRIIRNRLDLQRGVAAK